MERGAGIAVDFDRLGVLESDLTRALSTLTDDFEIAASLSGVLGDSDLSGATMEFGASWNFHRFAIRDQVEWLRDSVRNIAEELKTWDATKARLQGS